MAHSFDIDSPKFKVRKLSIVSQNIFQSSFDISSPKSLNSGSNVLTPKTPKSSQDMLVERRIACCHFIELVFFMFAFLFLIWLHEDIEQVFKMEHILEIEMSRPFGQHSHTVRDIREVDEIWEWLDKSLLPVMINHKDEVGHYLPREDWGYLAEYNRVIGGMRFEQTRSKSVKCEYDLNQFYGNCQPIHTHDHHSYGYPECEATNSTNTTTHTDDASSDSHNITACFNREDYEGAVDFYHDEGFTMNKKDNVFEMWIDLIDSEANIWKRETYLKDRHWIDRETKKLKVEILVYNSQEQPLICKVVVEFEFTRVGYVTPSVDIETIALSPYFSHGILKGILEVMYVLLLFDRIFTLIKELKARIVSNQEEPDAIYKSFINHFWTEGAINWLDLTNIVVGAILCVEWGLLVMNLRVVEDGLAHLHRPSGEVQYDDNDADVWSEYHHDIADIEHAVEDAIHNMTLIRGCATLIVFAMIFEFFKVLEGIPALKRVADTLNKAWAPLLSFALVLSVLVTLFAGAGMLAFGQKMEGFHNIYYAVISTLVIISTGSSEIYNEQFTISPLIASIWYWLLVTIMYLVCLRLILCILMDAYGEASEAAEEELDHTTLLEQGYDTLKYLFYHHVGQGKAMAYRLCSVDDSAGNDTARDSEHSSENEVTSAPPAPTQSAQKTPADSVQNRPSPLKSNPEPKDESKNEANQSWF